MMPLCSTPVARLLATVLLSGAALTAGAAPTPDAEQFLQILHRQATSDSYDQFAVTGLYADEHGRQFASAILSRLGEQKAYRDDLQAWLAANPAVTQEELVSNWLRRYQQIRLASFDFLDKQDVAILFRLPRLNPLYGTARSACETRSQKETYEVVHRTRHALLDEHKDRLADAIAAAYLRELARIRHPAPGDRPPGQVETMRVMAAFKNLVKALPADDAAILSNEFAHDKRMPRTPQQECNNVWAASHAILDATVADASLLRKSVTHSAYSSAFAQQAPLRVPALTRQDFTPGKASIYLPLLLQKRKVSGVVNVNVSVDEAGKVSAVTTNWNSLAPSFVESANGETFASMELMLPVFDNYYRDGKFAPKLVDGKATAFSFSHEIEWK
ncbi:hypothetical protein HF313_18615 [Massilia atriviolacea]|uniref:Energy transducer TonB n=1 Tax=Massilia atriviolacea TaxID=2495579 RepID=A0A430HT20_9BURK|nr:hypothetical protein [Massilia atriviolacea]RSZ60703.1 hypothetical protein EJB06_00770 [Massilia atriviolacea]